MKKYVVLTLISILIALACACLSAINRKFVSIAFTGDILLDRGVRNTINEKGVSYPYRKVKNVLSVADIAYGNLECPVTDKGTPALKRPYLIFRGDQDNISALKEAGYDILNLANNHIMDYGHDGLTDTMDRLSGFNITITGAGKNREEAYKPVFIKKNGLKIGLLSFSDFPPEGYVYSDSQSDIARTDDRMIHSSITAAKKQCDFLVVSFHWGTEYSFYPGDMQKKYAHEAADYGADLVIGHHPHVLQGIEKYNNSYIFYSLGNFIFDRQIYPKTDESVILCADIDSKGIKKIEILPVKITNSQPEVSEGEDGEAILKNLIMYSEGKGLNLKISDQTKIIIYR